MSSFVRVIVASSLLLAAPLVAHGQGHVHDGEPAMAMHGGGFMSLHMEMSPTRAGTSTDSARAAQVARTLRSSIAQYADTTAAVKDGYKMFMPKVKIQKIYHFTSSWRAMQEAFRFDPAKPTSLLYRRDSGGKLVLVGAMYTAPKRFSVEQLDERVPTSLARWHKHVNWCVPRRGATERWMERKNGAPVFGPESSIATKAECDAVGGAFHETIFGWMLHANVFAGDDPATVWGDDLAGHDMQEGMKMDRERGGRM